MVVLLTNTTLVGVAVFSVTRKKSVNTANEQMSMPEPLMAVKIPPKKPAAVSTIAFQFNTQV